jgi:hypothetical protein
VRARSHGLPTTGPVSERHSGRYAKTWERSDTGPFVRQLVAASRTNSRCLYVVFAELGLCYVGRREGSHVHRFRTCAS